MANIDATAKGWNAVDTSYDRKDVEIMVSGRTFDDEDDVDMTIKLSLDEAKGLIEAIAEAIETIEE